jgi:phenylacetate-CoA ligase
MGRELLRLTRGRLPSADEQAAIRRRRLRELVRHVHDRVPYYRKLLDDAGASPQDIRDVEDLSRIPPSTREQLRSAGSGIFARGFDPGRALLARTSGSTGRPWSIYRTHGENLLRRAVELRSMRWAGVRPGDLTATLGPLRAPTVGALASLGFFRNEYLSIRLPVDEQIARLREIRPSVLWIYPSALRTILQRAGSLAAICRPRLVIFSAEALDASLREQLRYPGGPEVRNFYGAVETGRIAWECPAGEGLHVNADCLILELEEEETPGAGHRLLITNLHSFAMPLVRYRLGDRVELIERPCSCGVALPLMRPPIGREWDLIVLPSGRLSPPLAVTTYLSQLDELTQYRVTQTRVDRLVFQFVCSTPPHPDRIRSLRSQLERHFGEPMELEFQIVDHLDEIAGKARVYISAIGGADRRADEP